jgi:hypothetical protein
MKLASLIDLLSDFEELAKTLDASAETLEELREFKRLLTGHENEAVATFVGKLAKGNDAATSEHVSQPILHLQQTLTGLQKLLASASAKAAANDLGQFNSLLQGCSHDSIAMFVDDAKRWAETPPRRKRVSKQAPVPKRSPAELVQEYVHALTTAANDNAVFDQVAVKLKSDKGIRTQEMREIAKSYLGYELAKKKGRGDALREIIDRQALEARQEARGRSHGRLKSW